MNGAAKVEKILGLTQAGMRDAEMRMAQRMPKAKREGPKKLPYKVKSLKGGDRFK